MTASDGTGSLFAVPRLTPKSSATCREGGHGFCSGRMWTQTDRHGRRNVYSRCQCPCHGVVPVESLLDEDDFAVMEMDRDA